MENKRPRLADLISTGDELLRRPLSPVLGSTSAEPEAVLQTQVEPSRNPRSFLGDVVDFGGAFLRGTGDTATSLGATADVYQGDTEELLADVQSRGPADLSIAQQNFREDIKTNTFTEEDEGWLDSLATNVMGIGGAAVDNPAGAFQEVAAQAPNSAVALGSMYAGAKAGALLGSTLAPGIGTIIGTLGGGIIGMFLGNTALETGGIAQERAAEKGDSLTEDDLGEVAKQGAIKGGFITAVDVATLGLNKYLAGGAGKAVEASILKTLKSNGVNINNALDVATALQNKTIREQVVLAGGRAFSEASGLGRRTAQGIAGFGLETVGEGVGEYAGSAAAGLGADMTDAVLESLLSMPQSMVELRVAKKLGAGAGKYAREVEKLGGDITGAADDLEAKTASLRRMGKIESKMREFGLKNPENATEQERKAVKLEEERSKINPVTGEPIQTGEVSKLSIALNRAKRQLSESENTSDKEYIKSVITEYNAALTTIQSTSQDPIARQEANAVLTEEAQKVPRPPQKPAEETTEATPTENADTTETKQLSAERQAKINKRNGTIPETDATKSVTLPTIEGDGGGILGVVGDDSTGNVESLVTESDIKDIWDNMPEDATAEQLIEFQDQFPNWYEENVEDGAVNITPSEEEVQQSNEYISEEVAAIEQAFQASLARGNDPKVLEEVFAKNYPHWAANRVPLVDTETVEEAPEHLDVQEGDTVVKPTEAPAQLPEDSSQVAILADASKEAMPAFLQDQAGLTPEEGDGVGTPVTQEQLDAVAPDDGSIIPYTEREAPAIPFIQEEITTSTELPQGSIVTAKGTPYKNERVANARLNKDGLQDTHEVVEVEGGFAVAPITKLSAFNRESAFTSLAQGQRDKPEAAMLTLQREIGGGVLSGTSEHVGDLSHRIAEPNTRTSGGIEAVAEKVTKTLRSLRHPYGFEKEHLENLVSNAEYDNVSLEERTAKVDKALAKYAAEHKKLKVYNLAQQRARDAAVGLGNKDYAGAIRNLEYLETLLQDEQAYLDAVNEYDANYVEASNLFSTEGAVVEEVAELSTFSETSTGYSTYDAYLDPAKQDYFRDEKGLDVQVRTMTPDQYLQSSTEGGKDGENVSRKIVDEYKAKMESGEQVEMPFIDTSGTEFFQEGRHRVQAAKELGITEISVLTVDKLASPKKAKKAFTVPKGKPVITSSESRSGDNKHVFEDGTVVYISSIENGRATFTFSTPLLDAAGYGTGPNATWEVTVSDITGNGTDAFLPTSLTLTTPADESGNRSAYPIQGRKRHEKALLDRLEMAMNANGVLVEKTITPEQKAQVEVSTLKATKSTSLKQSEAAKHLAENEAMLKTKLAEPAYIPDPNDLPEIQVKKANAARKKHIQEVDRLNKAIDQAEVQVELEQKEATRLANKRKRKSESEVDVSDEALSDIMEDYKNGNLGVEDVDNYDGLYDDDVSWMYGGSNSQELSAASKTSGFKALMRLRNGENKRTVWSETGWHQGKDGLMRFEINDDGVGWVNKTINMNTDTVGGLLGVDVSHRLGNVFEHPELFKHYPQLAELMVRAGKGSHWFPASTANKRYLQLNANLSPNMALPDLLHELMHAIQQIENFNRGGNIEVTPAGLYAREVELNMEEEERAAHEDDLSRAEAQREIKEAHGYMNAARDAADNAVGEEAIRIEGGFFKMTRDHLNDLVRAKDLAISKLFQSESYIALGKEHDLLMKIAFEQYERLAGEVEARDVAERWENLRQFQDMPLVKQGIPMDEMTIRYDDSVAFSWTKNIAKDRVMEEGTTAKASKNGQPVFTHNNTTNKSIKALVDKYNVAGKNIGIEVFQVESFTDLPKHMQIQLLRNYKESGGKMKPEGFRGGVDPETGNAYVITSAIATIAEMKEVLVHEITGHAGVKNMFDTLAGDSNAYSNMLAKEAKRNKKLLNDASAVVFERGYTALYSDTKTVTATIPVETSEGTKYLTEDNAATVLDEFIAFSAEELIANPDLQVKYGSFRKRLIAVIKHALRKIGIASQNMTQADIYSLVAESNARLFDTSNKSAVGLLQAGRGYRYQIARFTDPSSADFAPEAAQIAGTSPVGSWAKERVAAQKFEAKKTPLQRRVIEAKQVKHDAELSQILDSVESGVGKVKGSILERFADTAWNKVKDTRIVKAVTKHGALGNITRKRMYQTLSHRALGPIGSAEAIATELQDGLRDLSVEQKKQVMDYFTTRGANVTTIHNIPAKLRNLLEKSKLQLEKYGDELVELGLLSQESHQRTKGSYLPGVYFKYLSKNQRQATSGKRLSFMGYLKAQKDLNRNEQVELGKIVDPSIIIPDALGTIGRDIALYQFTNNVLDVSEHRKTGWVLGNSHKINYVDQHGRTRSSTFYDMTDEVARLKAQLSEGLHGPLHDMDDADLAFLREQIDYAETLLTSVEKTRESEIIDILVTQGIAEEAITPAMITQYEHANYKKMPSDKAYGNLSGKIVMKGIYNDFVETVRVANTEIHDTADNFIMKGISYFEPIHQMWKLGKVALNFPASLIRNSFGNLVLLDTSSNVNLGTTMGQLTKELSITINAKFNNGEVSEWWQMGKDYGLLGTTFAANELNLVKRRRGIEILAQIKQRDAESGAKSPNIIRMAAFGERKFFEWMNAAADFYGGQEGIFKVVKLKQHIQAWEKQNEIKYPKGLKDKKLSASDREAIITEGVLEADRAIFNYGEVPAAVRWARRAPLLGSPFLTFTYKSAIKVPENFVKHPAKSLTYGYMTSMAASALYATVFGLDFDEEEATEAMNRIADYNRHNPALMVIPTKDANGNLQYTDLAPILPHAQHQRMLNEVYEGLVTNPDKWRGAGDAISAIAGWSGFLGAPILNTIITGVSGVDPFTGREITPTGTSGKESLEAWSRHMIGQLMPPWMSERGVVGHALDNYDIETPMLFSTGRELNSMGNDRETGGQVVARGFGLNVTSVDQPLNMRNMVASRDAELRELNIRFRSIVTNRNMTDPQEKATKLREVNERKKLIHQKFKDKLAGK